MSQVPAKIILFDGVCNFCNWSVQFVMKRDSARQFYFASLQSDTGQALLERYGLKDAGIDSVVLIDTDKAYIKSRAALRIARGLDGWVKLLSIFRLVPTFLSDIVYDFVAANRYRWFGKRQHCMIPDKSQRAQFLT
jgi:predicted DCC family thiol-disulfide oxidoreductase YuxK